MRRTIPIIVLLLSACCLRAADPSLLMRTRTDPTRMRGEFGVRRITLGTGFLRGGETAFTAVVWLRMRPVSEGRGVTMFTSLWSIEAARATREGGAALPAVLDMTEASGTRAWTFADPRYVCPVGIESEWQYGCYAVNVETPCALTVTLAGAERQVAASNGVVQAFNMQGSAADWSLAVAPADPSATYRIGFAVNPLVRFFGLCSAPDIADFHVESHGGAPLAPSITNEWMMCAVQARIEGAHAVERMAQFTWDAETWPPGETTNGAGRATFARDARVSIGCGHLGGVDGGRDVWGFKVFPCWLTDDQLRNVRDLDMFEMRRRGIARRTEEAAE